MPIQRRLSAVAAQLGPTSEHFDPLCGSVRSGTASALSVAAAPPVGERTLTVAELAHFRSQGYVVVPGVFEDADFADLKEELGRLVDGFAQVCVCARVSRTLALTSHTELN